MGVAETMEALPPGCSDEQEVPILRVGMGGSISRPEGAGVGRAMGLGVWSEDEHVLIGDFLGESAIIAQFCRKKS